jgi:hypothetical protein
MTISLTDPYPFTRSSGSVSAAMSIATGARKHEARDGMIFIVIWVGLIVGDKALPPGGTRLPSGIEKRGVGPFELELESLRLL